MEAVIFGLFGRKRARMAPVNALLERIVAASREPALYLQGRVPDDFEGRFEALTLHLFLVLRRLRELPAPAADAAQDLIDASFAYLELGFRQGGISDIAVPKRMKKIGRSFYGRLGGYEEALAAADADALAASLARNIGPEVDAAALARHVAAAAAVLATRSLDDILAADPLFPPFADRLEA
ncbi:ubiquinol-cytochrome C chaperone family protein [Bosea sp. CS1GBMeth4]|uniref:ubiquinol-cytochrome C chaperone family protein n=1 Tax=Bosea sp. CS1GBMeth4 TaxID=1892849 RepID=UPI001FCF25E9|nr:ubiquinol-cytochrome C chaperone family protein [Bosea sp. CS1GBMeth4]